jgi:putative ABC transport system ATP-binding protein
MIPAPENLAVEVHAVERVYDGPEGPVIALSGVDLTVAPGTMVAVRGRSGSGKTTLLNLVGALDQPTAGEVHVFGRRIDQLTPGAAASWRAETLGFVFQAHALMPAMSALENVDLGLRIAKTERKEAERLARESLERVGLGDRLDHRPSELSGGQQQRVAVARAIATGNRLVLADEPTAGLDSSAASEVFGLFRSLVDDSGITILMATHDPLTEEYVDAATHLEGGRLVVDRI